VEVAKWRATPSSTWINTTAFDTAFRNKYLKRADGICPSGNLRLAFLDGQAVAVRVISFAVSTSVGAVVAKMDDVYVRPDCRRRGVGAAHFAQLCEELMRIGVARIDTSVHIRNNVARHFYQELGSSRCTRSVLRT
jgi:predicted GNAT family acetyltransferase